MGVIQQTLLPCKVTWPEADKRSLSLMLKAQITIFKTAICNYGGIIGSLLILE